MIFTAIFCLIAALIFQIPLWAFVVGFLCALMGPFVALFGMFLGFAMDASWGYWVLGAVMMCIDIAISGD